MRIFFSESNLEFFFSHRTSLSFPIIFQQFPIIKRNNAISYDSQYLCSRCYVSVFFCSSFFRKKKSIEFKFCGTRYKWTKSELNGKKQWYFRVSVGSTGFVKLHRYPFYFVDNSIRWVKVIVISLLVCSSLYFTILSMTAAVLRMCSSTRA